MTLDLLPPALQLLALLLGTVAVPLIVYLFSRRAQLRQLNTTSDATLVTSAATLVTSLQSQIKILDGKVAQLEGAQRLDRAGFLGELDRSHDETVRVSVLVAQLKTDLDICHRQVTTLQRRIENGSPSA
jgi:hypothetical protein